MGIEQHAERTHLLGVSVAQLLGDLDPVSIPLLFHEHAGVGQADPEVSVEAVVQCFEVGDEGLGFRGDEGTAEVGAGARLAS